MKLDFKEILRTYPPKKILGKIDFQKIGFISGMIIVNDERNYLKGGDPMACKKKGKKK
jgi:hypothetical protein